MNKDLFRQLDGLSLLQCLVYGEASGEPIEGKIGVAWVVRNRALNPAWWGRTWKQVMLKRYQFSCFDDRNAERIIKAFPNWCDSPVFKECRWVASGVMNNDIQDNTFGANHYHAGYVAPSWSRGAEPTVIINNHIFYQLD